MEEENGLVAKLEALNINGTETTKQRWGAHQAAATSKKKLAADRNSFKGIIDVLVSWSLEDIFNQHLFKTKVPSFVLFSSYLIVYRGEDLNF